MIGLALAAGAVSVVLVALGVVLWAERGAAVFIDMMTTGLAWCV